jgi:hypothetical protein
LERRLCGDAQEAAATRIVQLELENKELRRKLTAFRGTARDVLCHAWASTPHSSIRGPTPALRSPASCHSPELAPQVRDGQSSVLISTSISNIVHGDGHSE